MESSGWSNLSSSRAPLNPISAATVNELRDGPIRPAPPPIVMMAFAAISARLVYQIDPNMSSFVQCFMPVCRKA